MTKKQLEIMLSKFKGSEDSFPFGDDALVYKVMGKMFALVSQNETIPRVTLKCDPADAEVLVSQFNSIIPGYYMNKKHWITVSLDSELPAGMVTDLAARSYDLVTSKLSKSNKKSLNIK